MGAQASGSFLWGKCDIRIFHAVFGWPGSYLRVSKQRGLNTYVRLALQILLFLFFFIIIILSLKTKPYIFYLPFHHYELLWSQENTFKFVVAKTWKKCENIQGRRIRFGFRYTPCFFIVLNLFFLFFCCFFSVWWKADNLWEFKDSSGAKPPACPQTSVCEPGYHRDRVPPALQGTSGGAEVGFLQQLLPGQDSERHIGCRTRHMEIPSGMSLLMFRHKLNLSLSLGLWCVIFLELQVNFEDEARIKFLKLLGFSKDELERKVFCFFKMVSYLFFESYHVVAVKTLSWCRFQNVWGRIFNPTAMELMPKILQRRCSVSQLRSDVLHSCVFWNHNYWKN